MPVNVRQNSIERFIRRAHVNTITGIIAFIPSQYTRACGNAYLGTLSPTPGIYRVYARMLLPKGRLAPPQPFRPLSRRSGRIPALPYPPPRSRQYKSAVVFLQKMFARDNLSQGINTLVLVPLRWPVLKCPRMAGFQMSTEGRRRRPPFKAV